MIRLRYLLSHGVSSSFGLLLCFCCCLVNIYCRFFKTILWSLNQFNIFLVISYHWWSHWLMEFPVNTLVHLSRCLACRLVLMLCLWAKPEQGFDGALNEVSGFIAMRSGPLTRLLRAAWHVAAAWGRRVTPEVVLACSARLQESELYAQICPDRSVMIKQMNCVQVYANVCTHALLIFVSLSLSISLHLSK